MIEMSYVANGKQMVEKAARIADRAVYQRYVMLFAVAPPVVGAGARWAGLRGFNR